MGKRKADVTTEMLMFVIGVIIAASVIYFVVVNIMPALLGFGGSDDASIMNNFLRLTGSIDKSPGNTAESQAIFLDSNSVIVGFNRNLFADQKDWSCKRYKSNTGLSRITGGWSDSELQRPARCADQPCLCLCKDAATYIKSEDCAGEDAKCVIFKGYTLQSRIKDGQYGCQHGVFIPGGVRPGGATSGLVYIFKDENNKIIYIDDGDPQGQAARVYGDLQMSINPPTQEAIEKEARLLVDSIVDSYTNNIDNPKITAGTTGVETFHLEDLLRKEKSNLLTNKGWSVTFRSNVPYLIKGQEYGIVFNEKPDQVEVIITSEEFVITQ